jgi:hypothetical protein
MSKEINTSKKHHGGSMRILVIFLSLTISAWAQASSDIRLDNGRELIRKGDKISKLHEHIKPSRSYSGRVCQKPSNTECKNRNYTSGSIYEYDFNDKGLTYIVQTNGRLITYIKWRRLSSK